MKQIMQRKRNKVYTQCCLHAFIHSHGMCCVNSVHMVYDRDFLLHQHFHHVLHLD